MLAIKRKFFFFCLVLLSFAVGFELPAIGGQVENISKSYHKIRSRIQAQSISDSEKYLSAEGFFEMDKKEAWRLTFQECTEMVLKNNINIQLSYLDVDSSALDIVKEKSVFDPVLTADSAYSRSKTASSSGAVSSRTEGLSSSASIEKQLITDGVVSVSTNLDRTGLEPHTHATGLGFSVSQPLLRGFANSRKSIKIAVHSFNISVSTLKNEIIQRITDAQISYWEILNAREVLDARKAAHQQALDLLEQNRKELKLGNRTATDVLQAEATAASREGDILQAENQLRSSEDDLKKLLSGPDVILWDTREIIPDTIPDDFSISKVDPVNSMREAFQNRPDYRQVLERLLSSRLSLSLARNSLLPDLSVDYSMTWGGAGDSARDSFNRLSTGKFPDQSVGFSFTFPLFDREERADYQQQKNDLKQKELGIKDLQLDILKEVRESIRDVNINAERAKVAQIAYDLQNKKLEAEKKKYNVGVSTSFEVLTFQRDLVDARVSRIRAIADYQESLIRLWQTLGTTLQKNQIDFEETSRPVL